AAADRRQRGPQPPPLGGPPRAPPAAGGDGATPRGRGPLPPGGGPPPRAARDVARGGQPAARGPAHRVLAALLRRPLGTGDGGGARPPVGNREVPHGSCAGTAEGVL